MAVCFRINWDFQSQVSGASPTLKRPRDTVRAERPH